MSVVVVRGNMNVEKLQQKDPHATASQKAVFRSSEVDLNKKIMGSNAALRL